MMRLISATSFVVGYQAPLRRQVNNQVLLRQSLPWRSSVIMDLVGLAGLQRRRTSNDLLRTSEVRNS